jgi:long-subunit fatty acid transport protein
VFSTGWFEPYDTGSRYYTIGAAFNRPDRTSFSLSYRQADPLNSRAVNGSLTYQLSPRYFLNTSTSYDFGIHAIANTFNLVRQGSDLTISLGMTYNSLVNSFGIQFMVMPNLLTALVPSGQFTGSPISGSRR